MNISKFDGAWNKIFSRILAPGMLICGGGALCVCILGWAELSKYQGTWKCPVLAGLLILAALMGAALISLVPLHVMARKKTGRWGQNT